MLELEPSRIVESNKHSFKEEQIRNKVCLSAEDNPAAEEHHGERERDPRGVQHFVLVEDVVDKGGVGVVLFRINLRSAIKYSK